MLAARRGWGLGRRITCCDLSVISDAQESKISFGAHPGSEGRFRVRSKRSRFIYRRGGLAPWGRLYRFIEVPDKSGKGRLQFAC